VYVTAEFSTIGSFVFCLHSWLLCRSLWIFGFEMLLYPVVCFSFVFVLFSQYVFCYLLTMPSCSNVLLPASFMNVCHMSIVYVSECVVVFDSFLVVLCARVLFASGVRRVISFFWPSWILC